jgi:hypothetical protein
VYKRQIVNIQHQPETIETGFSLLGGENGLWMLQPVEEIESEIHNVKLESVDPDCVFAKIEKIIS